MKGKIKFIQENGQWSNSSGMFNKYQVTFADDQSYQAPTNTLNKPKYDTGQSILRQVSFKGVIELISAGKIALSEAEHYTNEFHNLLNK